jgi:hypothetical protein
LARAPEFDTAMRCHSGFVWVRSVERLHAQVESDDCRVDDFDE